MHGKNMDAFQHLLSRMIENITKKYIHVHLEVNDYMKTKDERLFRFLDSKISFVMSTGKTSRIPNLTSYERKKAHNYIATREIAGLSSHSDGEGAERALFLAYSGPLISAPSTPHG
jgi:predicted RNA-binding protein Jag